MQQYNHPGLCGDISLGWLVRDAMQLLFTASAMYVLLTVLQLSRG